MYMADAPFAVSHLHRSRSKRAGNQDAQTPVKSTSAKQRKPSIDGVSARSIPQIVVRRGTEVSTVPGLLRSDSLAILPSPSRPANLAAKTPTRNASVSITRSHHSLLRHLHALWHANTPDGSVKPMGYVGTRSNGLPPVYVLRGTDLKLPMLPTSYVENPKGAIRVPGLREVTLRFSATAPSSASPVVWQETWEIPVVSYAIPGDHTTPGETRREEWEASQAWMKIWIQDMFPKADIDYLNKDDRTSNDLMMADQRQVHVREKLRRQRRKQHNAGLKIECRIGGYGVKQAFAQLVALQAAKKPVLEPWLSAKAKARVMQQLGLPSS